MPVCQQNVFGQKQQCIPRISTNHGTNTFVLMGCCYCVGVMCLWVWWLYCCTCLFVIFVWPILSCFGVDGNCAVVGPQGCVCACVCVCVNRKFCQSLIFFVEHDFHLVMILGFRFLCGTSCRTNVSHSVCSLACLRALPNPAFANETCFIGLDSSPNSWTILLGILRKPPQELLKIYNDWACLCKHKSLQWVFLFWICLAHASRHYQHHYQRHWGCKCGVHPCSFKPMQAMPELVSRHLLSGDTCRLPTKWHENLAWMFHPAPTNHHLPCTTCVTSDILG